MLLISVVHAMKSELLPIGRSPRFTWNAVLRYGVLSIAACTKPAAVRAGIVASGQRSAFCGVWLNVRVPDNDQRIFEISWCNVPKHS